MVSFSLLKNGRDDESPSTYIKSQMPGQCISLENVTTRSGKLKDFYIICQFVSKVTLNNDVKGGVMLELKCREGKQECRVLFVKKLAEQIEELILQGKISVDDYILLQNPTIAVLYMKDNVQSVQVEIGQTENQSVIIWKTSSLFYIEPFLMRVKDFSHIIFYELDNTGSAEHVLSNMCHLVSPYGPIKPLCDIAGSNAKSVALATFTKTITPLNRSAKSDEDTYIQIKFNEILLESKPYVHTSFIAFFFSELAKEIERAVNTKRIEPGDLLALICPLFKSKKSAPINIHFPPNDQINLIVLKNQYPAREIGTKICQSDVNLLYYNGSNTRQECNDDDFSLIKFVSLKKILDTENAILKIESKLKKYGKFYKLKDISEDSLQKGLIGSYFLKLIKPNGFLNEDGKVTFYLREINFDCLYGAYFKLVLGPKFLKSFYLAVKNRSIVRGDIICFLNPFVWQNPAYIPTNYIKNDTYLVEIAIPEKQGIVVFKLSGVGKEINLGAKESQSLELDNVNNPSIPQISHIEDVLYKQQLSKKDISSIDDCFPQKNSERTQNIQIKHKKIRVDNDNSFYEEGSEKADSIKCSSFATPITEEQQNKSQPLKRTKNQCDNSHTITRAEVDCETNHTYSKSIDHKCQSHATTRCDKQYRSYQHKSEEKQQNQISGNSNTESQVCVQKADKNIVLNQKQNRIHTLQRCGNNLSNTTPDKVYKKSLGVNKQNLIPEECFFESDYKDDERKAHLSEYKPIIPLLPILLTKPSIKHSLDMVSGFCNRCNQMYPYSSMVHNHGDFSNSICPKCSKVLNFDFCLEVIAVGLDKLVTVLLQGAEAEKYLNITCEQFLNYEESCRDRIVRQFEEELNRNKKYRSGRTIKTTDTTYWWYKK